LFDKIQDLFLGRVRIKNPTYSQIRSSTADEFKAKTWRQIFDPILKKIERKEKLFYLKPHVIKY
jgi:hypothetical protein